MDGPDADVAYVLGEQALRATLQLNLAFLDAVLGVLREDSARLDPVEHEGLRQTLLDFIKQEQRVTLDGVPVTPVFVDFEVREADPKLVPLFPAFGAKALTQMRLRIDYPVKSPPDAIGIVWAGFPLEPEWRAAGAAQEPMPVIARLAVGGGETSISFRHDEPEFVWHRDPAAAGPRFDAVPVAPTPERPRLHLASVLALLGCVLALLLGGRERRRRWAPRLLPTTAIAVPLLWPLLVVELPFAGAAALPDEAEAAAIFAPLHANIYRAFDYAAEGEIYDALARSVDGALLDTLYDQVYRGLVMAEHGGAVSRVQAVRPMEAEVESIGLLPPDDRPGFVVRARWQVDGIVRHWGHSHWRTNEHEARYTVAAGPDGWRIVASTVLDQKRVAGSPIDEGPAAPEPPPFQQLLLPPGSDL